MQSLIITIHKSDEHFPEALKAIGKDCPERIYAIGNLNLLLLKSEHMVAIIGSRKATRAGCIKAYEPYEHNTNSGHETNRIDGVI